jgi:hypothetical protein
VRRAALGLVRRGFVLDLRVGQPKPFAEATAFFQFALPELVITPRNIKAFHR